MQIKYGIKYNKEISIFFSLLLLINSIFSILPLLNIGFTVIIIILLLSKRNLPINEFFLESERYRLDLLKSEHELSTFFKLTPSILGMATTVQFFKINDIFSKKLGYNNNELLNEPFINFIHPDDVQKTKDMISKAIDGDNIIIDFENRYRKSDGNYILIKWQAILINNIFYVAGVDITKQRKLLESIKESEAKFRKFFENSYAPMCIFDTESLMFTDVNAAFCNELEYSKDEIINLHFSKFVYSDDLSSSIESVKNGKNGIESVGYKNRYITKSGKIKEITWYSTGGLDRYSFCVARIEDQI